MGSIFVQLVFSAPKFTHHPTDLGWVLGIFAPLMFLGALVAWIYLPEVQDPPTGRAEAESWPVLPSKTLEVMASGYATAIAPPPAGDGQNIGFNRKFKTLYHKGAVRWKKWRRANSSRSEGFGMQPINGGIQPLPQEETSGLTSEVDG